MSLAEKLLKVKVVDVNGIPLKGARVTSYKVNHNGKSPTIPKTGECHTDHLGEGLLNIAGDVEVRIKASRKGFQPYTTEPINTSSIKTNEIYEIVLLSK